MKIFILFLILSVFSVHAEVNYDEYIKEVQNFHQKKHPKNAEKFALLVSEMNESEFSEDWKNLVVTAVTRFEHVQNFISYYGLLSESEKKALLDNREVASESFKKAFEAFNKLNPEQKHYLATYYLPDNKKIEVKNRIAVLGRLNQYYFRLRNNNNYLKGFDAKNLKYEPDFRLPEKFDVSNNNNIVKLLGLSQHSFFLKLSTVHDSVVAALSERDKERDIYWKPLVKYAPYEAWEKIGGEGPLMSEVLESIKEQKSRNKKVQTLLSSGTAKEKEEAVSMLEDAYLSLDSILGKNHKITLEAKIDLFTANLQLNKLSSGDLSELTNELVASEAISDAYLFSLISKFVAGLNENKKFEQSFELLNADFEPVFLSSKRALSAKMKFDIELHDLNRDIIHGMFNADESPSQTYKNKSYALAEKRLARLKKDKGESSEVYKQWAFVYAAICSSVSSCKKEIVFDIYNRYFKSALEKSSLKSADINLLRKFSAEVYSFRSLNSCFVCEFGSAGKYITAVDMYLDTVLKAHENGFYKNEDIASVIKILERDYYSGWPLKKAVQVYDLYLSNETNLKYTNFNSLVLERLMEMKSELIKINIVDWDTTIKYARLFNDKETANVQNDKFSNFKKKLNLAEALIRSSYDFKNKKTNLVSENYREGLALFNNVLKDYAERNEITDNEYLLSISKFKKLFEYSEDIPNSLSMKNRLLDSISVHLGNLKKDNFVMTKLSFQELVTVSNIISNDYSPGETKIDFKFNNIFKSALKEKFGKLLKQNHMEEDVILKSRYAALLILFYDFDLYMQKGNSIDKINEEYRYFIDSAVSVFKPGSENHLAAYSIQSDFIDNYIIRLKASTALNVAIISKKLVEATKEGEVD
jgi:hypothetical protein